MTIQSTLKKEGYNTYAEVAGPLSPIFGLNKGFDKYNYRDDANTLFSFWKNDLKKKLTKDFKKPYFSLIHIWALHNPRKLTKKSFKKHEEDYSGSLEDVLLRLFSIIDNMKLDDTVVMITGDHGERIFAKKNQLKLFMTKSKTYNFVKSWLFHKYLGAKRLTIGPKKRANNKFNEYSAHGFHLYDYLIKVPLFMLGKGIPKGKIIKKQVRHIDIPRTILSMSGSKKKLGDNGKDLTVLFKDENNWETTAYCSAINSNDRSLNIEGIRKPPHKFIISEEDPKFEIEIYNLEKDPKETKNLVNDKELNAKLYKEFKDFKSNNKQSATIQMSKSDEEALKKRLSTLGYLR